MKVDKRIMKRCYSIESKVVDIEECVLTFKGVNTNQKLVEFEVRIPYYMFRHLIGIHIKGMKKKFMEIIAERYNRLKDTTIDE